jgi:flavin prenyltransferase
MSNKIIILAITGASGAQYALRLLECLLKANVTVHLLVSDAAKVVLATECDWPKMTDFDALKSEFDTRYKSENLQIHSLDNWFAPVASGSAQIDAMVVCPCSMGSLAAIANGASRNLLERAADVCLKEGKRLVIVPREAPVSAIHLEHMLKLARLGVKIIPASPGFYHKPQSIDDLVDFMAARVLDQLGVEHNLGKRWGS